MRKFLLAILLLALCPLLFGGNLEFLILAPYWVRQQTGGSSWSDATGMVLDASGEKLGFRYWPNSTSDITDLDLRLNVVGAPGNFKIGVFANTGSSPDDATQLGAYTASFAAPGADGLTGLKTLLTDTGALTLNSPIWVVIEHVSGTIDGSNYIQLQSLGAAPTDSRVLSRHHNGTNWTTTASVIHLPVFAAKHANLSYSGNPTGLFAFSAQADIFVNAGTVQAQGIRMKYGSQIKMIGVAYNLLKTGTPGDLKIEVFEGDTSKYSNTVPVAQVPSVTTVFAFFNSPVLITADATSYILLTQAGTSSGDIYDLNTYTINSTYAGALVGSDFRFVYGNGVVPSALTVSSAIEIPYLWPLVANPTTDFDAPATSGGGIFIADLNESKPLTDFWLRLNLLRWKRQVIGL